MRSFCLSSLPFTFPGILVTEVIATPQQVVVHATSQVTQAVCPTCQEISSRIHSSYTRSPADLPSSGRKVLLVLRVRRFRCRNSECQQQTFVERLAALPVSARQTSRLGSILENLSIVLGLICAKLTWSAKEAFIWPEKRFCGEFLHVISLFVVNWVKSAQLLRRN